MNDNIKKLSDAFSYGIREELTKKQLAEVVKRNEERKDFSCATHDFCDANMVMFWSFGYAFQRELDISNASDIQLINAAWELSKKSKFK